MVDNIKKLEVCFFCTKKGTEPVREWLRKLTGGDKKKIGEDIKTVQLSWPLGMPLVKSLGNGLWEIRSNLLNGRISRVLFFMNKNRIVLVQGFIKKAQKTPQNELALAKKRKGQFEHEESEVV